MRKTVACLGVVVLLSLSATLASAEVIQDFDDPAFTLTQHGTAPGPGTIGGGPTGNYLMLTWDTDSQTNTIAFDEGDLTGPQTTPILIEFDFRMSEEAGHTGCCGQRGDGFGVALMATALYGSTGPGPDSVPWERPAYPGAFAVGFDIFDSGGADDGNTVSLNWDGTQIAETLITDFELNTGVFNRASVTVTPDGSDAKVTMTITEDSLGTPGEPVTVFEDVTISGMDFSALPDFRAVFGGRTGGAFVETNLDNITIQAIPEPSTVALTLLGLVGLIGFAWRRRKV